MKGPASITAAIGSSGSMKSEWIKRTLRKSKPARLVIWDLMNEYGALARPFADDRAGFIRYVTGRRTFAAAFQPGADAPRVELINGQRVRTSKYQVYFRWFCEVAYALGHVAIVVEELASVTQPNKAPPAWRAITLQGRHQGLKVIGTTQRPASIDKDFLANCTLIHCGRLVYPSDAAVMADVLGLDSAERNELGTLADGEFFERNMLTGQRRRARLSHVT